MLKVSIDTCILLDLLLDQDPESMAKLAHHQRNHDELVICGMVYGELFPILLRNRIDTALFLSEMNIATYMCRLEHYAFAGRKWSEYLKRRRFVCPACGESITLKCAHCDSSITFRQHILADFIIGAFSELDCDGLLTRDKGYYKTYFPNLKIL